jgi:integrase
VTDDLDPLDPESAVELYLDHRSDEVSAETLESHKYRLDAFLEWCDQEDMTNMNDLSGRDLHAYRVWRREEGDLEPITLQGQLSTLRVFLGFCESVDAVPEDLRSKVLLPSVDDEGDVSESTLDPARAESALDYLERYRYASREHVSLLLLWRTGMRMGALRSIDLADVDREEAAVHLTHDPDTGTPLKNGPRGERWVALTHPVMEVVADWIDGPRPDIKDEHGREPLISTSQGRAALGTIRQDVYRWTTPCVVGDPCPHDRDPEECEAAAYDQASKCPSSRSPHDVRSGAITAHLLDDVPTEIVSDRMNVSQQILSRHYDRRTAREKMEQRRRYLRD